MKRRLTYLLIIDYVLYVLARLVEQIVNLLPERTAFATGRFLGRLVYVILPDRRSAAIENLTIAYGREKSPQWIRSIARKNFEHVGISAVEFFRIRRWTQAQMAEKRKAAVVMPYAR